MRAHALKRWILAVLALALVVLAVACAGGRPAEDPPAPKPASEPQPEPEPAPEPQPEPEPVPEPQPEPEPAPEPQPEPQPEPESEPAPEPAPKRLIVIDPGHQAEGNYDTEPLGPGADEQKAKVSSGTRGVETGLAEYELNLTVSALLRDILTARGYDVVLTHETAEVDISNIERAAMANELQADAFVRIHANGSEDPERHGALTICPTPENPYHPENYAPSRALSEAILDALCAETGALREQVWETDTMTGINHSEVPVTIVEMGYMSNREEDLLLSDPAYQQKLAAGIANGIDAFFEHMP